MAADLYVGRALYDQLAATVGTSNLVAGLRYSGPGLQLLYASAAAPLGSDAPWWGAVGGAARLPLLRHTRPAALNVSVGLGLGGHGYLFRDPIADGTGSGATLDAGGYARLEKGTSSLESRAARLQYESTFADNRTSRHAVDLGARLEYAGTVRLGADARWMHVDEGDFPAISADATGAVGALRVWVSGEQWLASDMRDTGWGAGLNLRLPFADAWVAFRRDTRDPLYWNPARRNWSLGLTRRLGARTVTPLIPLLRNGSVVLQLPLAAASADVAVAGEFSDWQPIPMRRAGRRWELQLTLEPGVYRYAFIDADGTWFVPESVPGRMADGMGGFVAVLIVP